MATQIDPAGRALAVMRDGDTDLEAFFGHFAHDCRFRWANDEVVVGVPAIQAAVAAQLAGITGLRHDVAATWVRDDSVALEMEVTYTLPDGGVLQTPAITIMRFRDDQIYEYVIYQDPTPLKRAAASGR